ncbi:pesticin C-terminus-like muramidase [Pseudomonas yamanorum]|uniref:Calcium sensor EFh n=1 Tax=Pseudomonas yamanorum TaxID=515393 RepID=A0A7Y8FA63_9PSED|nr:pesticin C-terminus-like muramidase [Pseudomonas yamanorum]NWE75575.1 calcium sensor EFh [Pseudomonas yamanorum]
MNWLAEKERIKQISWWNEVAPGIGLPAHGQVYHLHPVGLVGQFDFKNDLKIIAGKVTFDAEGNDTPGSMHYSRVVHWPGNDLSGVTLGRGYDMGNRTAVEIHKHMTSAGISDSEAKKLSLAHGLKGDAAKEFVRKNKASIAVISMQQQISLFNIIYPDYVKRIIFNYERWTANEADRVSWVDLDPAIQDVLVDFVYQGFTAGPNPMRSGMQNSRATLIAYIEGTPGIKMYEPGRGRAKYLKSK